jgi:hypothetical protein
MQIVIEVRARADQEIDEPAPIISMTLSPRPAGSSHRPRQADGRVIFGSSILSEKIARPTVARR